jgi:pimeloyl-ACP methyl ester carboxylesterase
MRREQRHRCSFRRRFCLAAQLCQAEINTIMKKFLLALCLSALSMAQVSAQTLLKKPVVFVLGGTPSNARVADLMPDSLKAKYRFLSLNRPGFGGTPNGAMSKRKLYKLAKRAGLRKSDYAVIATSGGAPFALLLAQHFHLQHCGIISGMVSRQAFMKYADQAITKDVMMMALGDYAGFEKTALQFPNLNEIVKQAGAPSEEVALRACYDEFNFILNDRLFPTGVIHQVPLDWWHGEKDVNVPFQSAEYFLQDFPNAKLHKISDATHGIDGNIYVAKLLQAWAR